MTYLLPLLNLLLLLYQYPLGCNPYNKCVEHIQELTVELYRIASSVMWSKMSLSSEMTCESFVIYEQIMHVPTPAP